MDAPSRGTDADRRREEAERRRQKILARKGDRLKQVTGALVAPSEAEPHEALASTTAVPPYTPHTQMPADRPTTMEGRILEASSEGKLAAARAMVPPPTKEVDEVDEQVPSRLVAHVAPPSLSPVVEPSGSPSQMVPSHLSTRGGPGGGTKSRVGLIVRLGASSKATEWLQMLTAILVAVVYMQGRQSDSSLGAPPLVMLLMLQGCIVLGAGLLVGSRQLSLVSPLEGQPSLVRMAVRLSPGLQESLIVLSGLTQLVQSTLGSVCVFLITLVVYDRVAA